MIAFADLLERLVFTPGRLAKIALLRRYFATQPDPDRGFGLAALTGELAFQAAKPAMVRALVEERTDPVLFAMSRDYVGDLAETVALIWPAAPSNAGPPRMTEVVQTLISTPKSELPFVLAGWLDASDASVRYALLKLITGELRVGASARLAKVALAEVAEGRIDADEIEEVWHGLTPPYAPLFAWIEGRGPRPDPAGAPVFRSPMLAHPLEAADIAALIPSAFRAEWKWDGIRVQLVATPLGRRVFSRGADDISAAFPEIVEASSWSSATARWRRSPTCSSGSTARRRAPSRSVTTPWRSASTTCCSTGPRICALCRSIRGARGLRPGMPGTTRRAWTCPN